MRTISADQFKQKYGDTGLSNFVSNIAPDLGEFEEPKKGYFSRIIDKQAESLNQRAGELASADSRFASGKQGFAETTVQKIGSGLAAGILDPVKNILSETPGINKALESYGKVINWLATSDKSVIKKLGDQIGKSPTLQDVVKLYDEDESFRATVNGATNIVTAAATIEGGVRAGSNLVNKSIDVAKKTLGPAVSPETAAKLNSFLEPGGNTVNHINMNDKYIASGDFKPNQVYQGGDLNAKVYTPKFAQILLDDTAESFKVAGAPQLAEKLRNYPWDLNKTTPQQVIDVAKNLVAEATKSTVTRAKESLLGGASKVQEEVMGAANLPEGAAKLSLTEKFIGLSPDIKKRISGKQAKLKEYFDVAKARNVDDTAPTPYEYGSNQVQKAVDAMDSKLSETGGIIGDTRKKLATYKAATDDVAGIESSFVNELNKLNLEIRNGTIAPKVGTVSRLGSTSDLKILNDLYKDLLNVKKSPTVSNLIDLRNSFDKKINFAKSSREASDSVDALSRNVRKSIADTNAKIVGKSQAAELQKYSDFMDAYNDLKSFTDRRAGGEYLLRLVLSGRGGEARRIIQTINEYTGIDLLDDATMMTLATDFIGNLGQKNLFRQEMTKAGLDTARLLKGDPSGLFNTILQKTIDSVVDPERVLLQAAE